MIAAGLNAVHTQLLSLTRQNHQICRCHLAPSSQPFQKLWQADPVPVRRRVVNNQRHAQMPAYPTLATLTPAKLYPNPRPGSMMMARGKNRSAVRGKEKRLFNSVLNKAEPDQRRAWLHVSLCCSAKSNDPENCVALLKAGASPVGNEETERLSDVLLARSGGTDVLDADVLFEHDHLVETLLRKGAKIDSFDTNGTSPLRLAIQHGCFSAAKALLAAGADVTLRCSDDGCAPLDVACVYGQVKVMGLLLAAGANINGSCGRGTPR